MTISWSVRELLPFHCGRGPVFVIAQLWLGTDGAWVFDMDTERIVTLADAKAIQAIQACLPGPEYLGEVLLQGWLREGPAGFELYDVYWLQLGELEDRPASQWLRVDVRPVPPPYDVSR